MSAYHLSESKSIAMMKFLALCFFVISLINIPIAEARIRHYKWELKYEYKSPDCYKKLVITINGRTPGPTILAQQNDTVIVEVKNSLLTANTAIHWHGIRQIGTPWFDGTEGFTQCPILPGDTFVYKFVVDRPGTYLYHAHYGMQREEGLFGSIRVALPDGESEPFAYNYDRSIILTDWYHKSTFEQAVGLSSIPFQWVGEPQPGTYLYHAHYGMQREEGLFGSIRVALPDGESEPFAYNYDRSIILTDWYHKSTFEQAVGLSSIPFQWVGEPQSLLIQGKGRFDCSAANPPMKADVCNNTNPECSLYSTTVVPGKTYRLRISSLTALSALSFQIEGHNMTVVEADGHYVEPFVVKNLFIYSGETYSVLVYTDQDPARNYWVTTNVVSRNATATTPPGLAVLNYYPNHPRRSPPTIPPSGPMWNDVDSRFNQSVAIRARKGHVYSPPATSDRVIVLLNTQNRVNGKTRWSVNNVSYDIPHTPYLIALKENLLHTFSQTPPPEGYDFANYDIKVVQNNTNATTSDAIYRLQLNSTVDIVLQNANTMNPNNSETHPWHLHGHDFWVLGYGKGKFDPINDPKKYNLVDPIMKNTVPVHPFGWTVFRFKADNPGVWAFHCHIESHFFMGMGVVFEEGIERVGKLPSSIMGCGETKHLLKP